MIITSQQNKVFLDYFKIIVLKFAVDSLNMKFKMFILQKTI